MLPLQGGLKDVFWMKTVIDGTFSWRMVEQVDTA